MRSDVSAPPSAVAFGSTNPTTEHHHAPVPRRHDHRAMARCLQSAGQLDYLKSGSAKSTSACILMRMLAATPSDWIDFQNSARIASSSSSSSVLAM